MKNNFNKYLFTVILIFIQPIVSQQETEINKHYSSGVQIKNIKVIQQKESVELSGTIERSQPLQWTFGDHLHIETSSQKWEVSLPIRTPKDDVQGGYRSKFQIQIPQLLLNSTPQLNIRYIQGSCPR